jgi:hypothetical protein
VRDVFASFSLSIKELLLNVESVLKFLSRNGELTGFKENTAIWCVTGQLDFYNQRGNLLTGSKELVTHQQSNFMGRVNGKGGSEISMHSMDPF